MTAIVGILCQDGVVIGADSSATFVQGGDRTIEQPTEKLEIVEGKMILSGTGCIGLGQRFLDNIQKAWANKDFSGRSGRSPIDIARGLCQAQINDFAATNVQRGTYGALLAFPYENKHYLFEFALADFQPEMKTRSLWYCSMGCTQTITDSFLALIRRTFWRDGPPSVRDAIFATVWTLHHAIQVNPGGVNGPIRIAVLEKDSARLLTSDEMEEHEECVRAAEEHLGAFPKKLLEEPGETELPKPPSSQA